MVAHTEWRIFKESATRHCICTMRRAVSQRQLLLMQYAMLWSDPIKYALLRVLSRRDSGFYIKMVLL